MADQATTELLAESISPGESSQPQTTLQLRRTRTRKVPTQPNTKKSSSHRDTVSHHQLGSSIKSEASGPHRSASIVSLQSMMPSSTISVNSGILSPKYTKTGRISKAQKGVRGAHVCGCGRVSFISIYCALSRISCIFLPSYIAFATCHFSLVCAFFFKTPLLYFLSYSHNHHFPYSNPVANL
jgi:hypothetical protein